MLYPRIGGLTRRRTAGNQEKSCHWKCGQRCRKNISPAVSLSKKKGALIGRAAGERSRPLKKLNQVCRRARDCSELCYAAGGEKAVRHKVTMSGLLALCGLALLVQHVAELGSNFTGDHLVAGALTLGLAVIVWCVPSKPKGISQNPIAAPAS